MLACGRKPSGVACCAGRQDGLALVLLVFLLGLVAAGATVKMLAMGSFSAQAGADDSRALQRAKQALVGYVIAGLSGEQANPGRLPCPENIAYIGTAREGEALGNCSGSPVGRFAWRTLGTGGLKDGGTNRLWYALATGFRQQPINSDTPGLTVDGTADDAVAVLISPGPPLAGQSRATGQAPRIGDYLDLENADGDEVYVTRSDSAAFNDRLLAIAPDDIFPALERRVLSDLAHYLHTYRQTWGAYPFPAPFTNPAGSDFVGVPGNTGGLLPVAARTVAWLPSTIVAAASNAVPAADDAIACDASLSPRLVCTITATAAQKVTVRAQVSNLGLGFYRPLVLGQDIVLRQGRLDMPHLVHTLDAAGNGFIVLTGVMPEDGTLTVEFIRPPAPVDWDTLQPSLAYVFANRWHTLLYYKVAPPFLPGGDGQCGDCLRVNRPAVAVQNVHALLMSAGRRLDMTEVRPAPSYGNTNPAQTRPSGEMAQYFDSVGNIAADRVFDDSRQPRTTFNDQVEIIE